MMKEFEEKMQSLALNEPPAGLKQRVLKNAVIGVEKKSETGKPARGMLMALVSSKWFILLILPFMLISSVGVFAIVLEERGAANEWEEVKSMLDAAGESLDWTSFFPPAVPDVENFMGTPALQGVELDTRGLSETHPLSLKHQRISALPDLRADDSTTRLDFSKWTLRSDEQATEETIGEMGGVPEVVVLELIEKDALLFEELAAAAKRKFSQPSTPIVERLAGRQTWELSMGHLSILQKLAKICTWRAIAAARLGDRQKARESLEIFFKCQEAAFSEGTLINGLVGMTLRAVLEHRLPDILREDCWTDEDLIWLQQKTADGNGFDQGLRMFRSEMAIQATSFDEMMAMSGAERREMLSSMGNSGLGASILSQFVPNGIIQRNKATSVRWMYQFNVAPLKNRDVEAIMATKGLLEREVASLSWFSFGSQIAALSVPSGGKMSEKILMTEMHRRMMATGVALERYQRAEGAFPPNLGHLVPAYLESVPLDLAAGEGVPIGYSLKEDGYEMKATPVSTLSKDDLEFVR